jgi:hypothetical protein
VVDGTNQRVQKFDSDGNFINKWGSLGSGNSEFNQPFGIDIDSSGNLFVADSLNLMMAYWK